MRRISAHRGIFLLAACLFLIQWQAKAEPSDRIHSTLDFIDIFPRAKEKQGSPSLGAQTLKGSEIRSVIKFSSGDSLTFRFFLHRDPFLNFEWCMWGRGKAGNVLIKISGENRKKIVFRKDILPDADVINLKWRSEKIDLSDFSGQWVDLTLSMAGGNFLWANPAVYSRGKKSKHQSQSAGPNVILISIDTLRADHLGCYGYDRKTSPTIDRLAADGVLFERAYAQAHWTLPSHISLLTSLYPDVHRVPSEGVQVLAENIPTLASILKERGFLTGGFAVNCGSMSPVYGFNHGFARYSMRYQAPDGYNRRVERWLEDSAGKRFFLFLHLFDVHSDSNRLPYDGPEAYIKEFTDGVPSDFSGCRKNQCASQFLAGVNQGRHSIKPEEVEYIRSLYDAGIRVVDDHLAFLLDTLKRLNLLDQTILIFSSDHGEAFMEHGKFLHAQFYEELIHVPIIFYYPGGGLKEGMRVQALVENIDIMPTILDLLRIKYDGVLQGKSLVPHLEGKNPQEKMVYGASVKCAMFSVPRRVVRSGPWKLIIRHGEGKELFNLDKDPREKRNRIETEKEIFYRLMRLAEKKKAENEALHKELTSKNRTGRERSVNAELSQAEKENLRALGYLDD